MADKDLTGAVEQLSDTLVETLSDDEKRERIKALATQTVKNTTQSLTNTVNNVSKGIASFTAEDLTPDKLTELAKEGGDAVVEAIESAGQLALFGAGGSTRILAMLAKENGILDISSVLSGKSADTKPETGKPKQGPGFFELIMSGRIAEAFSGLKEQINLAERFSGFIKKLTGFDISGAITTARSYLGMAEAEVKSALGEENDAQVETARNSAPPSQKADSSANKGLDGAKQKNVTQNFETNATEQVVAGGAPASLEQTLPAPSTNG